jgi:hypothetical protein
VVNAACAGKTSAPGGVSRGACLSGYDFPHTDRGEFNHAFDRTFIASAATWSKLARVLIVGFCRHLTTTALGRSLSGSTGSTFSVWPIRLPLDSGVTLCIDGVTS